MCAVNIQCSWYLVGVRGSFLESRDLVANHSIQYFCRVVAFYFLVIYKTIMALKISGLLDSMKHGAFKEDLKVAVINSVQEDRVKDVSGLSVIAV